jgi:hypothetical protein
MSVVNMFLNEPTNLTLSMAVSITYSFEITLLLISSNLNTLMIVCIIFTIISHIILFILTMIFVEQKNNVIKIISNNHIKIPLSDLPNAIVMRLNASRMGDKYRVPNRFKGYIAKILLNNAITQMLWFSAHLLLSYVSVIVLLSSLISLKYMYMISIVPYIVGIITIIVIIHKSVIERVKNVLESKPVKIHKNDLNIVTQIVLFNQHDNPQHDNPYAPQRYLYINNV